MKNVDMSIRREFSITERTRLEFRADANNAFNIVNLSNPGTSINSSQNVGRIASAGPMRQAQLGLKTDILIDLSSISKEKWRERVGHNKVVRRQKTVFAQSNNGSTFVGCAVSFAEDAIYPKGRL